jgi:hypothetical protein
MSLVPVGWVYRLIVPRCALAVESAAANVLLATNLERAEWRPVTRAASELVEVGITQVLGIEYAIDSALVANCCHFRHGRFLGSVLAIDD